MDDMKKEISEFVRQARKKLGLTQEGLADVMGCTKQNIFGWEKGLHQPSYSQLVFISKKSGIPLPHDRAAEFLDNTGINFHEADVDQLSMVKSIFQIKEENRPQADKVIAAFIDKPGRGKEEEGK